MRLWPEFGGGETVTRRLANEFVERGIDVHVLYFKHSIQSYDICISPFIHNVQIRDVKCDQHSFDIKESPKVNDILCNYINVNQIDIVFNQWFPHEFITQVKVRTQAKVVKCLHTAFLHQVTELSGLKGLIKKILNPYFEYKYKKDAINEVEKYLPYVDKFVFLSKCFENQYLNISTHYANKPKLCSIWNPLTYSDYITAEEVKEKRNIVLIVGRLEESCKRISRAISAWAEIERTNNSILNNWILQVVGDGSDKETYISMARELKLKRISFEGYQNPKSYYKEAKIFLMTSSLEGFGMTLIESQQNGVVPIVMDSFLSLHDIIESGRNGYITPDKDVHTFAETLKGLMLDERKWKNLSLNAINDCKKFDISTIADRWIQLFYELKEN